eukprot:6188925-Pleurochrysis_carterae.AAC.4
MAAMTQSNQRYYKMFHMTQINYILRLAIPQTLLASTGCSAVRCAKKFASAALKALADDERAALKGICVPSALRLRAPPRCSCISESVER